MATGRKSPLMTRAVGPRVANSRPVTVPASPMRSAAQPSQRVTMWLVTMAAAEGSHRDAEQGEDADRGHAGVDGVERERDRLDRFSFDAARVLRVSGEGGLAVPVERAEHDRECGAADDRGDGAEPGVRRAERMRDGSREHGQPADDGEDAER
jgi:hypothetical protein